MALSLAEARGCLWSIASSATVNDRFRDSCETVEVTCSGVGSALSLRRGSDAVERLHEQLQESLRGLVSSEHWRLALGQPVSTVTRLPIAGLIWAQATGCPALTKGQSYFWDGLHTQASGTAGRVKRTGLRLAGPSVDDFREQGHSRDLHHQSSRLGHGRWPLRHRFRHLRFETCFEDVLGQPRQQSIRADQIHHVASEPLHQFLGELSLLRQPSAILPIGRTFCDVPYGEPSSSGVND